MQLENVRARIRETIEPDEDAFHNALQEARGLGSAQGYKTLDVLLPKAEEELDTRAELIWGAIKVSLGHSDERSVDDVKREIDKHMAKHAGLITNAVTRYVHQPEEWRSHIEQRISGCRKQLTQELHSKAREYVAKLDAGRDS